MNATETRPAIDPLEQADLQAVIRHAFEGAPIDPDVIRRVDERANRVTEEIRRLHGFIDSDKLIRNVRDES